MNVCLSALPLFSVWRPHKGRRTKGRQSLYKSPPTMLPRPTGRFKPSPTSQPKANSTTSSANQQSSWRTGKRVEAGWQEGCVRACGVPGSPRNPLPRHPHSSPVGSRHCYPHFRDERTEAQRVRAMCPELQSTRRELGFIPGHGMPCPGPRESCVYRKPDTLPSGVSH